MLRYPFVLLVFAQVFLGFAYGNLTIINFTSSNALADQGQYEIITLTWSGGSPSYQTSFRVTNTLTNSLLSSAAYTGIYSNKASFTFLLPQNNNFLGSITTSATLSDSSYPMQTVFASSQVSNLTITTRSTTTATTTSSLSSTSTTSLTTSTSLTSIIYINTNQIAVNATPYYSIIKMLSSFKKFVEVLVLLLITEFLLYLIKRYT